jgi:DUF438 domain-containing protein
MATIEQAAKQMIDIANRFSFHKATEVTAPKHDEVRSLLKQTATTLAIILPAGRETAVVMTKLEEAMFWANAAIARETPTEPTTAAPGGSDS